jgi:hypothetical protein
MGAKKSQVPAKARTKKATKGWLVSRFLTDTESVGFELTVRVDMDAFSF